MGSLLQLLPVLFLYWFIINIGCTSSNEIPKPYIVYMGSSSLSTGNLENFEAAELAHLQLLSSIIPSENSERISFIHHYNHAFKGFSALLTDKEASTLSGHGDVVSVFPDPILQLHTTRSWDFLHLQPNTVASSYHKYGKFNLSRDVIIGVIDTGIWPESKSFKDTGMSEIPSRWKGVCMESSDFNKSHCNRKLIGARYYTTTSSSTSKTSGGSPRDPLGHGTHVASTAAGSHVANVSYFGLAKGAARGGSPTSRIASYKACSEDGCSGSTILKAFEDAIKDGVDIISISIGLSPASDQSDFLSDPIAIGAFHAEQMGVMVVCSAGNDGPHPYTVGNTAPWLFTVAASTIDRDFRSTVLLGNGKSFQGGSIHFSNLSRSKTYPLVFGRDVAANLTAVSKARSCHPGSLDPKKVAGKIIVCVGNDPTVSRGIKKLVAENAKAKGLILVNEDQKGWPLDSGIFPYVEVDNNVGSHIIKYISSIKNPTATILLTVDVPRYRPAPVIAYFSSRGPGPLTENIIKPDITAPGVAILAAVVPKNRVGAFPIGEKPPQYATRSGTSMSCPHVSGAVAVIKSVHHQWTSSMIKSALMTTATAYDNLRKPMKNNTGYYANPHEMGAGEINPLKALNPGLVFETTTKDYFNFLCYFGYSEKAIRSMLDRRYTCPKKSADALISNINYPSISISKLARRQGVKTVGRTVTNIGSPNATYTARVHAPSGLLVKVLPKKIDFTDSRKRVSFKVAFYSKKEASGGYKFGSITWFDGQHSVRMVFAVNVE